MMNIILGNTNNILISLFIFSINFVAFLFMKMDKKFAQTNHHRISEKNLLIIAIFGGAFGIWIGMFQYRHKTKKIKFRLGIPLILLIQVYISMLILL